MVSTSMRFEQAPQDRLSRVEHLAPRFFREVLEWDYDECLVTDDSMLSDFATATAPLPERRAEVEAFLTRMQAHYLIDGRSRGSLLIVDLLECLQANGVSE